MMTTITTMTMITTMTTMKWKEPAKTDEFISHIALKTAFVHFKWDSDVPPFHYGKKV